MFKRSIHMNRELARLVFMVKNFIPPVQKQPSLIHFYLWTLDLIASVKSCAHFKSNEAQQELVLKAQKHSESLKNSNNMVHALMLGVVFLLRFASSSCDEGEYFCFFFGQNSFEETQPSWEVSLAIAVENRSWNKIICALTSCSE